MRIELAKNSDARTISQISRQLAEYGLRHAYSETKVKKIIAHESKNLVVAKINSKIVAFAAMSYFERSANLDLLAVRREFQNEGIGTTLVAWLEKVAINLGIESTHVQVRENNCPVIKFYNQLGYVFRSRRHLANGDEGQVRLAKLLYEPVRNI